MRSQHYLFAHKYIPFLFLEDPNRFLAGMIHTDNQYIHDVWAKVAEVSKEQNPNFIGAPSEGLSFSARITEDDHFIGIITMPPPGDMPEAYFVALVLQNMPNGEEGTIDVNGKKKKARVITLEKGMNFTSGGDRTVLAEWEKDLHKNFGDGPEPNWDAFLQSVIKLLS